MIKLTDEYTVDVTVNSYILIVKRGKTKNGDDRWNTVGYYGSLNHAIIACINDMMRRKLMEGEYELREAIEIIREQKVMLQEMLKKEGLE